MPKRKSSLQDPDYLKEVGELTKALERLGVTPILVGGMALVILGSRRVTRDFDFVIANPGDDIRDVLDIFYDRGFELAARIDTEGNVVSTIDNRRIAAIRIRIDAPSSVYFLNLKTGLKVDLLFDFPILAEELLVHAEKIKIGGYTVHMASEPDLIRLKKIARSSRKKPGDLDDISFLKLRAKAP